MKHDESGIVIGRLKKELLVRALCFGGMATGVFALLYLVWRQPGAWLWLMLTLGFGGYQFYFIWRNLYENRRDEGSPLYPKLGWANEVTIFRGSLIAMLAGFLFAPPASGPAAWLPGLLYMGAALLDFLDGYLARVTGIVSRLGTRLDMEWDSLGFLIVVSVAVVYGQINPAYLLLGAARFLFVYGTNRRIRLNQPVYALDESMVRRALAGAQMGFLAVVLLPVFPGLITKAASVLFLIPSLAHFWRDWLFVSGMIGRGTSRSEDTGWFAAARAWLPLVFRNTLAVLVGLLLLKELRMQSPDSEMVVICLIALPALILGAAGRITALVVLIMSGFLLRSDPATLLYWLIMVVGIVVMIWGTGNFSLWKPENWLIYSLAGEKNPNKVVS
jgi:CDP-diacylglycerol---glycerol-3-phosphate 3-phosphatidyltransferase